jgi:hypothetical protein
MRRLATLSVAAVLLVASSSVALAADESTGWVGSWWTIYGGTHTDAKARIHTHDGVADGWGYWRRDGGLNTIDYFGFLSPSKKAA